MDVLNAKLMSEEAVHLYLLKVKAKYRILVSRMLLCVQVKSLRTHIQPGPHN